MVCPPLYRAGIVTRPSAPLIEVDVIIEDPRWEVVGLQDIAEAAVTATLAHRNLSGEVVVMGCDDARIAALNADFRGKSAPTNVLSWPAEDLASAIPGAAPRLPSQDTLGDIAISYDTSAAEAAAAGIALVDHTLHLVVHATLHLLGHDHTLPEDGDVMERYEVEILAQLGLSDPYSR